MKAKGSVSNRLLTIITDSAWLRYYTLENSIYSSEVANQYGAD